MNKLSGEAGKLLKKLENYRRAAFWGNSDCKNLPSVATGLISIPSDSCQSNYDHRIDIQPGAKIRWVSVEEANELGAYGRDADLLTGLWVSDFVYTTY